MAGAGLFHATPRSKDPAYTSSVCPHFWLQDTCSSAERIAVLGGTHELGPCSDPSVLAVGDPTTSPARCMWGLPAGIRASLGSGSLSQYVQG